MFIPKLWFGYILNINISLIGDIKETVLQLNDSLKSWKFNKDSIWWNELNHKCTLNRESNQTTIKDESIPLNYYTAFAHLEKMIPRNATIVSEGANTMDIGRTMMNNRSEM